ncbi:MAG: SiaB family protein kinase [Chloroherpetonaceae bacterium]
MSFDLLKYYNDMNTSRILMTFKGAISQELLVELGSLVRNQLRHDDKIQRIFAVFVEMAQNILHYSAEKDWLQHVGREVGVGVIVISEQEEMYSISSGNAVTNADAERLEAHCRYLNALTKDKLKKLYQERRKQMPPEGSKGAGLGLIDMARKSDKPLEFSLQPLTDDKSFFTLNVSICKTAK